MLPHPPLLAFGIANLPMLGWLGAAAAPILIHLLSRRKYREMSWAAMEYLLAAMKRRARRIQLEQWLLLAVRTLLVVLVVLAVAEPYAEQGGLPFRPGGRTHRVLVLDTSYSMDYRSAGKSRFERAKELAVRIVDESRQGDAFTLVAMAAPPRVVVKTPSFEPAKMREEIEALELQHTAADLVGTLAKVQELLRNVAHDHSRLERHEVYFLSDLQRATWAPDLSEAARADFRRSCEALAREARLVAIDLGQPETENLAVTGLRAMEPTATVGRTVHFEAELKNFGRQPRTGQPVELWIDGRRAQRQAVDLASGAQASVSFSQAFETPADHAVEVRTPGDALEVDNHRWLVVPVRQAVRVLCINGRPSGERLGGATDTLVAALAPRGEGGPRAVEVDVAVESALVERELGNYDCIFLADVAQFTPSEARVLDAYLQHGGNLVFFLGSQVLADRYNRELGGGAGSRRILPARLGELVTKTQFGVDPLGYRHPIVRAFEGHPKAGLQDMPVYKHFKLEPEGGAKTAAALRNGDPLVVEEAIGRGHVVLVATGADASSLWRSFPPLVQEILAFCIAGQLQERNVEAGQPLGASLAASAAGLSVSVERPGGSARQVPLRAEGDYSGWTFDETTTSGIYTARLGPPLNRQQLFAVNVNTAESDLAQVPPDELRDEIWAGVPLETLTTWQGPAAQATGPIARSGWLHVDLLMAVFGLLLLETFLAWRFGHHQ